MPNAFCVAGVQHMCSNLLEDTHSVLDSWPNIFEQLKNIEAFLNVDERRARFRYTCLESTQWQTKFHLFKHFAFTLYEHRWHECVLFVRGLLPLLPTMVFAWDADRYVAGVDDLGNTLRRTQAQKQSADEQRQGFRQFNPSMLTATLNSPRRLDSHQGISRSAAQQSY